MTSPTRNAAILFADISGSTKLYEVLGNADAQQTIDRCLGIVKKICVDQGGRVVKTIGDEVLASFPTPDAAARAAIEIQIRISAQRTSRGTPITMHVGFHFGPTIEEGEDVFGDAVNVAARMTSFATSGQIFTSAQTVSEMSPVLRNRTRDHAAHTLKGKEHDIGMFEVIWQESEDELTAMSPRIAVAPAMIKLTHGLRKIELTDKHSVLTLGRDLQNDVVVADRKASRMHARIERRRDKFVFVDHSSNGSWVTIDGESEQMLRREELTLRGSGRISFGHAQADDPEEFLSFSCLD